MIYLLYISLGYLVFTSLILWMNKKDFTPLAPRVKSDSTPVPRVSICIPARNEAHVIARSVKSALNQDYPSFEVIVLDDRSTDKTPHILNTIKKYNPEKLLIINGKPKPDSWLGKSWACHQLSQKASGNLLLFLDADAWLEPGAVTRITESMQAEAADFITVWPMQRLGTFWEKVVIPIVYYGLLTLLPARYVHGKPGWLLSSMEERFSASFAAACGQCMVFKKVVYDKIGGHQAVKNEIVEDVALAKRVKSCGYSMHMYHGQNAVHCRMYRSKDEMWQGFRKNFLALYNNLVPVFIFMALLNAVVYVLPFLFLPIALWTDSLTALSLSLFCIILMIIQRIVLARWYSWQVSFAFTHPLGVLWFLGLGVQVLADYLKGIPPQWKDRSL